jgi:type IV secretion system protein VirB6
MATCPTIDPQIGTAQTLIQAVNCTVEQSVASSYGALMGSGGSMKGALTAVLVIYVALIGYRFMLGRSSIQMGDLVPRMVMIGAILALTTSWTTYQTLVYSVLTDGPQDMVRSITQGKPGQDTIAVRVDRVSKNLNEVANTWGKGPLGAVATTGPQSSIAQAADAARQRAETNGAMSSPLIPNNTQSSAPNFLSWSAMLLILTSAGSIVIAKALLGLLLAIGPAFALFALFENTRGLALGWARASFFLAFVPLLSTLASLGMLSMLEPMTSGLMAETGRGVFSLNTAISIFIAVLVMTGMILLAVRVSAMMVAGWVVSFKNQMSSATASQAEVINTIHMQGYEAGTAQFQSNSTAQSAGNAPRVDQMVQSIERAQVYSAYTSAAQSDTRILTLSNLQNAGGSDDTSKRQVPALTGYTAPKTLISPLRPARSWS